VGLVCRSAMHGLSGFDAPRFATSLVEIGIADRRSIMEEMLRRVGYRAEISDKGRKAVGLLNLLGGAQQLFVLASSRVYQLLQEMAEIVSRQAVQSQIGRHLGGAEVPAS